MTKVISGIQQIGIGIPNVEKAWAWYRKYFGMDIKIFSEAAEAPLMTEYTGNKVQSRTATLALNMQGGGGFEIWQYTSRNTQPPAFEPVLGDFGIYVAKIKCKNPETLYSDFKKKGLNLLGELQTNPENKKHFFVKDPHGFIFELVHVDDWFMDENKPTGGPCGCIIGVSDIDKSIPLYRDILEFDQIVYDKTGTHDLDVLPGKAQSLRRVLLRNSKPRLGAFGKLLGNNEIELIQTHDYSGRKIFENRFWGDLGFIHLCFDIRNMPALQKECENGGFPFTVDSARSFDMGQAAGHFSYIEDPDGTLIEFVETHKVPLIQKIGWYLNIKNREPKKTLPNWMLKALRFNRYREK